MSRLETAVVNALVKQSNYSELDQAKMQYGVRIIIAELYKLLLIYGIAVLLGSFVPTLITHLTFYVLRQKAFGYHFLSLASCIAWSVFAFPVLSKLLTILSIPDWIVWSLGLVSVVGIFLLGPIETAKHRIVNERHRLYLTRHLRIRLAVVAIVMCAVPVSIKLFIVLGLVIQCVTLLTQKLMIRSEFV